MASVTFYNFSKRKNSTATPSGSGTSHTVHLKDNTSLYDPVFQLSGDFPSYTYARWQGMYFYVKNIISTGNGRYDIECELDPMGTAAGAISSTTAFVQRSASDYNVNIPDPEVGNVLSLLDHSRYATGLGSGNDPIFDNDGCYIMRCVGRDGLATFILSLNDLYHILDFMFDDNGSFWDALWDSSIKAVYNPFQYIVSLMYTPISIGWMSQGAIAASDVKLGWWTANGYGYKATYTGRHFSAFSLTSPSRYFNDFRDFDSRFTQVSLQLPGGMIKEIPTAWLEHGNFQCEIVMDIVTGNGVYILRDSSGILASFTTQLAFPVQIGQLDSQINSVIGGALGVAGSVATGSALGVASSITGAVSNVLQPNPSVNGSQGSLSFIKAKKDIVFDVLRYNTTITTPANIGRPLCENRTLGNLSGFCKCAGASVSTNLPQEYKDIINDTLNSGFFIE